MLQSLMEGGVSEMCAGREEEAQTFLTKLTSGTVELRAETGRWAGAKWRNRLCVL